MTEKKALYFGYAEGGGHFLHTDRGRSLRTDVDPGFPWEIGHLDSELLKNREAPDAPDGRVHWTCGGRPDLWFAFFWWDRSGDKRGASNSGFYVCGFGPAEPTGESVRIAAPLAFAYACEQWPHVVARQHHPLVLTGGGVR